MYDTDVATLAHDEIMDAINNGGAHVQLYVRCATAPQRRRLSASAINMVEADDAVVCGICKQAVMKDFLPKHTNICQSTFDEAAEAATVQSGASGSVDPTASTPSPQKPSPPAVSISIGDGAENAGPSSETATPEPPAKKKGGIAKLMSFRKSPKTSPKVKKKDKKAYKSKGVIGNDERLAVMSKVATGELTVDQAMDEIEKLEIAAAMK